MALAILALEDGRIFEGVPFGATGEVAAEVVFNTAMAGYQEVVTDPSYRGQMVVFTSPHIGNVGVNPEDEESDAPQVSAVIVRELSGQRSNFRSTEDLPAYLKRKGIPGMTGADTRAIARHIRLEGAMRGFLTACPAMVQDRPDRVAPAAPVVLVGPRVLEVRLGLLLMPRSRPTPQ